MLKSVLVFVAAISCVLPAARAAEPSQQTRQLLQTIVAKQAIEESWRAFLDKEPAPRVSVIRQALLEKLDAVATLTPDQREQALTQLSEWTDDLTEELKTRTRSIDVAALASEMAQAVYPRYFTEGELKQIAALYTTSAYQKKRAFFADIGAVDSRTGEVNPAAAWDRYKRLFTKAEEKVLDKNIRSPLGQKLFMAEPALDADIAAFLEARKTALLHSAAEQQVARFVASLKAAPAK